MNGSAKVGRIILNPPPSADTNALRRRVKDNAPYPGPEATALVSRIDPRREIGRKSVVPQTKTGRTFVGLLLFTAAIFAAAGCQSAAKKPRDYTPTWARFFLEAGTGEGTAVTLPLSGVQVTVNSKPVITEGDITGVELVQVELGKALMFQLSPTATRDVDRLSGTHQGRRLVLVVNDAPLGARRIDGAITNGLVFVFAEVPEEGMAALVENLKKSTVALQKEIAKK